MFRYKYSLHIWKMKLIMVIFILSAVSAIHGMNQVLPTVAQISHILRQMPRDKSMPIEMRVKFVKNMYDEIVRSNTSMHIEMLKKMEQEKKRKYAEKLKELLEKVHLKRSRSKKLKLFLRFSF